MQPIQQDPSLLRPEALSQQALHDKTAKLVHDGLADVQKLPSAAAAQTQAFFISGQASLGQHLGLLSMNEYIAFAERAFREAKLVALREIAQARAARLSEETAAQTEEAGQ